MAIDLDTRANCFCTNGLQMYGILLYKSSAMQLSFAPAIWYKH